MTEIGPAPAEPSPEATTGCLARLQRYLQQAGVAYELSHHPSRYTAQDLAKVEHVPGRLVAKVVMVLADEKLVMVVAPALASINLTWVREALGAQATRLADEREFSNVFPDCELGAMPPFGNLYGVPVLVDGALTRDPVIFFNAGRHDTMITITYSDFAQLVRPRTGIFASRRPAA
jgi:Ala-tRNA(Pro) deacylase